MTSGVTPPGQPAAWGSAHGHPPAGLNGEQAGGQLPTASDGLDGLLAEPADTVGTLLESAPHDALRAFSAQIAGALRDLQPLEEPDPGIVAEPLEASPAERLALADARMAMTRTLQLETLQGWVQQRFAGGTDIDAATVRARWEWQAGLLRVAEAYRTYVEADAANEPVRPGAADAEQREQALTSAADALETAIRDMETGPLLQMHYNALRHLDLSCEHPAPADPRALSLFLHDRQVNVDLLLFTRSILNCYCPTAQRPMPFGLSGAAATTLQPYCGDPLEWVARAERREMFLARQYLFEELSHAFTALEAHLATPDSSETESTETEREALSLVRRVLRLADEVRASLDRCHAVLCDGDGSVGSPVQLILSAAGLCQIDLPAHAQHRVDDALAILGVEHARVDGLLERGHERGVGLRLPRLIEAAREAVQGEPRLDRLAAYLTDLEMPHPLDQQRRVGQPCMNVADWVTDYLPFQNLGDPWPDRIEARVRSLMHRPAAA